MKGPGSGDFDAGSRYCLPLTKAIQQYATRQGSLRQESSRRMLGQDASRRTRLAGRYDGFRAWFKTHPLLFHKSDKGGRGRVERGLLSLLSHCGRPEGPPFGPRRRGWVTLGRGSELGVALL